MMENEVVGSGTIFCFRHKKEKVTHICVESKCYNNPFLCSHCFHENVNLSYHYDHESNIFGIAEAIEKMSSSIKSNITPINKIFKSTIARSDHINLLHQIEKGAYIYDELEERIGTIKKQVQLELELLVKDFQKALLLEKQEYFKLLDIYQRSYTKNIEYVKNQVEPLLDFQSALKYYSNENNLYLKIISEARKKSDWLSKTKRCLQNVNKIIEGGNTFHTELNSVLNSANKIKLDIWPIWKGEQNVDKGNDLKYIIKRSMNQWAYIPELKVLGEGKEVAVSGSTKNYYSTPNGK